MIDTSRINKIFDFYKLGVVKTIEKIEIGFTNNIYSINEKYIVKVCVDQRNEERFEKEAYFYEYFKGEIPIPNVKIYDDTKRLINYNYLIYPKIQGANLYSKWHLLEESERRKIVRKICEILKIINAGSIEAFTKRFNIASEFSWRNKIVNKIEKIVEEIEDQQILPKKTIKSIKEFVHANEYVLEEQEIRIVYWDIHFDNVIIKDKEIIGIIDFERTELCSIDYVLDIVKRMMAFPKKYISAEYEKYAKKEDYENLLTWYKEFYPELFAFYYLDKRLDLYSIEQNLSTLLHWPNDNNLKEIINKMINLDADI